jgi:uncharacterized protein YcbX
VSEGKHGLSWFLRKAVLRRRGAGDAKNKVLAAWFSRKAVLRRRGAGDAKNKVEVRRKGHIGG